MRRAISRSGVSRFLGGAARRRSIGSALLLLSMPLLVTGSVRGSQVDPGVDADAAGVGAVLLAADTFPGVPYYRIPLRRPGDARGRVLGYAAAVFPDGPLTVTVTREGVYVYDLYVTVDGLPAARAGFARVLWVASPDLSHVRRTGIVEPGAVLHMRVDFHNKFLVFVSEERSADVDQPEGRIVLRGVSRSGRLESMFSHGFCPPDTPC